MFPKLNASQALFYLNDKDAHSFDKIPKSKDKKMILDANFHGSKEFGDLERKINEFDWQMCELGRKNL